jgi:hypothetical protein
MAVTVRFQAPRIKPSWPRLRRVSAVVSRVFSHSLTRLPDPYIVADITELIKNIENLDAVLPFSVAEGTTSNKGVLTVL